MISAGDYPTEKAELIKKEDTEKYEAVTSAGTTTDRDELEPSGLSLNVVKEWFDFTEKEEEEEEPPEIDFEIEPPEEENVFFDIPQIEFDIEEEEIDNI
jgi:hypothetical protein